jgi:hypothetical protein
MLFSTGVAGKDALTTPKNGFSDKLLLWLNVLFLSPKIGW